MCLPNTIFVAKKAPVSVTSEIKVERVDKFNLIDTVGFKDSNVNQSDLWEKLTHELLANDLINSKTDGLHAIIIPIMVPSGQRVDDM